MDYTLKQILGAAVIDWPRFELGLRSSWVRIRNRNERLIASPDGSGVACEWQWTSDLHVAKVFPSLGVRLLRRSLSDWPIDFSATPRGSGDDPQISFVVGHRGNARVPQLMATLATIAAQQGVACECIVVEQSAQSEVRHHLPAWVRYVHTPLPVSDLPYCRSWALNVGARAAKGDLLVFHDNDMLVPRAYASELWARHKAGFEVINLKRFVFYLSQEHSRQIQSNLRTTTSCSPESIVQNLEAGGSIGLDKQVFFDIGGYDESFVGWGGEDNEFWERAQTRKVWSYSYMPILHLWHRPQPEKTLQDQAEGNLFRRLSSISPKQRIAKLVQLGFGNMTKMDPEWHSETLPEAAPGKVTHDDGSAVQR